MPQVPTISLLLSGLLMFASCGDYRYQLRKPPAYDDMPPEGTWVAVESKYQFLERKTVYYKPETIRRDGDLVTLWQLTDYRWMQGGPRSTPRFLSTTTQKQFDCVATRLRLLAFNEFPLRMGVGKPDAEHVDSDTWIPVLPDSIDQALWEVACGTAMRQGHEQLPISLGRDHT